MVSVVYRSRIVRFRSPYMILEKVGYTIFFPQIAGSYRGFLLLNSQWMGSGLRKFAAAAALFPKLVSLYDFALGCRVLPLPSCFSSLPPFMTSLLAAAAGLSPKLVSLHDFALGCRCRLVSQACLSS